MIRSHCLCKKGFSDFKKVIEYKNEAVFKDFEGTIIAKCVNCGLLKTIASKKRFDPKQSRGFMYEKKRDLFIPLFKPIVNEISKYKKSGKVLDVGCSSGLMLELLQKKGFDVYGIEPNLQAYKIARKKFKNNILHGILPDFSQNNHFYVLLHRSKQKFDVIIFNHVLEHIENIHEQINMAKQLLKPDGILVVGIPNTRNIIFTIRKKFWEPLMPKEHIWHFTDNYITTVLKSYGFSVITKQYSNDKRQDYPFIKRVYFFLLSMINRMFLTGESVTLFLSTSEKNNSSN